MANSTNPATVYQTRLRNAVARLAEQLLVFRPLSSGGVQQLTIFPLVVPVSATVATTSTSGGSAPDATTGTQMTTQMYDGLLADALSGGGGSLTLPAPNSAGTTSTVVPALLIVQDILQPPLAAGDTFQRDGHGYAVQSVADELIAGLVIAVVSVATGTS